MEILVRKSFQRILGKAFLAFSTLASTIIFAQPPGQGGAIAGYDYLGSVMVNSQPHYYYVSKTAALWQDANNAASTLVGGTGYLATLTSLAENNAVRDLYAAYLTTHGGQPTFADSYDDDRNPWIGLTDYKSEGTFLWANGENCSDWRHWDCGLTANGAPTCEPNNVLLPGAPLGANNDEDYVQLLMFTPPGGDPTPGYQGETGKKNYGYWNDWFDVKTQFYLVEFGPSTCAGDQGCSPGFWKNHPKVWPATYSPNALGSTYFTFPNGTPNYSCNLTSFGNQTLMQLIQGGGGPGINGAATILLRAAVAGLLNAADPRVDYPLSPVQVVNQVNSALASCDRNVMTNLAGTLDGYNNLGCPIDAHGNVISGTQRDVVPSTGALGNAFAVSGYPNPSRSAFTIQVSSLSSENISIKVTDMTGRLIEQRTGIPANQIIQIGSTYPAGLYYIEAKQGVITQQLKLIKQ